MTASADIASPATRVNLLGLTHSELESFVSDMGEKPFRARQLMKWVYKRGVGDFDEITDLAKACRERLKLIAEVRAPDVTLRQHSTDGTRKWLLSVYRGNSSIPQAIEMV